jgi:two-component system, NarL family, invasion response regulator UvrY
LAASAFAASTFASAIPSSVRYNPVIVHRVLLVDDHAVVRRGVRAILEDHFAAITVREAGTGDEALAVLATEPLDAIILDLSMPGRDGFDLLGEIKHRAPKTPILIMSLHGEDQFALRALRAGASGYLTKSVAAEQLITAVTKIMRGGRYISESLADKLALGATGSPESPHEKLSDREFDVMRGIASGSSVSAIAAEMHLSVKTVSTYRTRLLEKMGMSTNAELTRYALERGLV